MTSVKLANTVWHEIKNYSILPNDELLHSIVEKTGKNHDCEKFVITNAIGRLAKKLLDFRAAFSKWKKNPEDMQSLEALQEVIKKPIKEGSWS